MRQSIVYLFIFYTLLSYQTCQAEDAAERILVSDIDDTIKRTGVLHWWAMLFNGMRSRNAFSGTAELYRRYSCMGIEDPRLYELCLKHRAFMTPGVDRETSYVTGAIKKLQWFSSLFVSNSRFPVGLYWGREFGSTQDFKTETIRLLASEYHKHHLVLVGDNGEKDPFVYKTIADEFGPERSTSFIHQVYKKGVAPIEGQTQWWTAADLAVHFFNRGWITAEDLHAVSYQVFEDLTKNPSTVIPRWMTARPTEVSWPKPRENKVLVPGTEACLQSLKRLLIARK